MLIADSGGGYGYGSMLLQVAPEDLLAGAAKFEEAADAASAWLRGNAYKLKFDPMGLDGVSGHISAGMGENVDGVLGAVPAVNEAIAQLTAAAAQMRSTAAQYGFTEDTNAGDVAAQGTNL